MSFDILPNILYYYIHDSLSFYKGNWHKDVVVKDFRFLRQNGINVWVFNTTKIEL